MTCMTCIPYKNDFNPKTEVSKVKYRSDNNARSSHHVTAAFEQRRGSEGRLGGFPINVPKPQSSRITSADECHPEGVIPSRYASTVVKPKMRTIICGRREFCPTRGRVKSKILVVANMITATGLSRWVICAD